jgi:exopolyphosphatase / guanosine-5'-triphosphate,3'-diphosphate pyrophosphatase
MTATVAVVDCGSTSVRCTIAEVSGHDWTVLEDAERPIELLPAIRSRQLTRADMDDLLRALNDVRQLAASYGATRLRAVASPSLHGLVNADVLFERAARQGVRVELIDGAEEGRLYSQALSWVLARERQKLEGDVLLMDLGTTTSSVSWVRDGNLVQTLEEHVGTDRMAFGFGFRRDAEDLPYCLDRVAHGATRVLLTRLGSNAGYGTKFDWVLITGKEPRRIRRRMAVADTLLPALTRMQLDSAFEQLSRLRPLDRNHWAEEHSEELPTYLAALTFMRQLSAEAGVEQIYVPELQLRVGLLMDFVPGAPGPYRLPRDQLVAAGEQLATRYGMSLAYARNTAALALQVFDAAAPFHHLPQRARELLELAALIHDLGAYLNVRARHKHSYYVIKNADISGLSASELEIVALTARYHRGRGPQSSHDEFRRLAREDRALVLCLAAILRVAYALDVERVQRIRRARCSIDAARFCIKVDAQNVSVERWAMARKGELFHSVFGLPVVVMPDEGP